MRQVSLAVLCLFVGALAQPLVAQLVRDKHEPVLGEDWQPGERQALWFAIYEPQYRTYAIVHSMSPIGSDRFPEDPWYDTPGRPQPLDVEHLPYDTPPLAASPLGLPRRPLDTDRLALFVGQAYYATQWRPQIRRRLELQWDPARGEFIDLPEHALMRLSLRAEVVPGIRGRLVVFGLVAIYDDRQVWYDMEAAPLRDFRQPIEYRYSGEVRKRDLLDCRALLLLVSWNGRDLVAEDLEWRRAAE